MRGPRPLDVNTKSFDVVVTNCLEVKDLVIKIVTKFTKYPSPPLPLESASQDPSKRNDGSEIKREYRYYLSPSPP